MSSDSETTNKPPPGVKKKMGGPETPPRRGASAQDSSGPASPGTSTTASAKGKQFPPVAPVSLGKLAGSPPTQYYCSLTRTRAADAGGRQNSRSKLVEVIEIDLSNGSKPLPEGIKLKSSNQEDAGSGDSKRGKCMSLLVDERRPLPMLSPCAQTKKRWKLSCDPLPTLDWPPLCPGDPKLSIAMGSNCGESVK